MTRKVEFKYVTTKLTAFYFVGVVRMLFVRGEKFSLQKKMLKCFGLLVRLPECNAMSGHGAHISTPLLLLIV